MGVPKFFRYISERYPCLSEFVKEYQIPVFDNLYLDMNGIIHMCSHPDDNNPHFRITEEKIFTDIFHYIEFLFSMIKPQKVFFMAVDGVAPRAKMNQQRGRRFRSAKDAEKLEEEAKKKGEKLPEVQRFDSNCITPGTEFMARLHEQLKYFVISKISTDKMWRKCKVILSGHETPGEGEHKIMDYIRYTRSQPGYDPNTRHCLYGLDADLIMLGLCTHEPHFSLLREEVKFGKKTKRSNVPEETRFYLLHLSLMREYLELEFAQLKDLLNKSEEFQFDIEKIIDDWILMGFLVGNDFIPNLPNLHIANGALPILYKVYIEVMPTLDGYINEQGTLNLERFEKFMKKLADIDIKNFEEVLLDKAFFETKTGRKQVFHTPDHSKGNNNETYESEDFTQSVKDPDLAALIQSTSELDVSSEDETDSSSSEDEGFKNFKNEYYRNKLEYQKVTAEVMREQAEGYVRAIQWNLNYYYNGVCSWSWFYPHHYSPYISDIKGFSNLKIDFELGKPFMPYEQLLAVLPTASKNLLPECYHHLMTEETSMIKSYYPEHFETDLNGKRQEWEAVVLVPFIDEKILLDAMKPSNELLTIDEKDRNRHGPMLIYEYSEEDVGIYKSPSYFPSIKNQARCTPLSIEDIRVPKDKLIKGAYPGAYFDVFYPGFPTMKHLKYEGELVKAKVKVFEMPSRNENMILKLISEDEHFDDSAPIDLLGQVVWVGWPHLVEAKVTAISNKKKKYIFCEREVTNHRVEDATHFQSQLEAITKHSKERLGIDHGKTNILVHVQMMTGRKYIFTSNTRISLEKQFSQFESCYPLQSIVYDIKAHDECHTTYTDVTDIFSIGSVCFSLTQPYYGSQGTVLDSKDSLKNNQLKVSLSITEEPDLSLAERVNEQLRNNYQTATVSASRLSITSYIFSRITGSLYISTNGSDGYLKSVNIGLDLKFNKKNEEMPGFTKKKENLWLYSNKAVDIVKEYKEKFPEVIEFLSRSEENDMKADEVFKTEPEEKVKEIQIWLRSLPTHNCERRVCGSSVLEPEVVAEIEKILDDINETPKIFVMQIKPQLLFKPELQNGNLPPDSSVKTYLFDRIVNIREGYAVPLGYKGTVIGIHKSPDSTKSDEDIYDIVFDEKFPKGMALNCSDQRGYRLPKASFINISHGKRRLEQKTGVPGALRARAKERLNNGNSLNGNVMNPNDRQQSSAFALVNKMQPNINRGSPSKNNLLYPQFQTTSPMQIGKTYDNQKIKNHSQHPIGSSQIRDLKINKENALNRKNPEECIDKQTAKVPPKSSQKPVNPSRTRTEVDTEFLKRMLHIDNSTSANMPRSNARQQQNEPSRSYTQPNVSQYDMAQSCSTSSNRKNHIPNFSSATARLLSYYQSNSLGCPRYMYFEEENGCRAQVLLPHGKYISGKVAKTREEASENVALDALNLLKNNPKLSREELPSRFPVPPSNWMERQQHNKPSQVFVNKSYQMKQHPKVPGNVMDYRRDSGPNFNRNHNGAVSITNSTAPNFVPLQALKKKQSHGNRVSTGDSMNRTSNEKFPRQDRKDTTFSQAQGNSTNRVQDGKDRLNKSGRARKTRIAANFQK